MTKKRRGSTKNGISFLALCFLRHLFGECVNKRVSSFEQAEVEKAENEHRDKCSLLSFVGISFHHSKGLPPLANFSERICDAAALLLSPLDNFFSERFSMASRCTKRKAPHFQGCWCYTSQSISFIGWGRSRDVAGRRRKIRNFGWLMILFRKWQNKTCLT